MTGIAPLCTDDFVGKRQFSSLLIACLFHGEISQDENGSYQVLIPDMKRCSKLGDDCCLAAEIAGQGEATRHPAK